MSLYPSDEDQYEAALDLAESQVELYGHMLRGEAQRTEEVASIALDLAGAILDFLAANGMDGPVFPEPGSTPASRAEKALVEQVEHERKFQELWAEMMSHPAGSAGSKAASAKIAAHCSRNKERSAYAKTEAALRVSEASQYNDPRRCTCPDWMEGPHQRNESCPMNFPIPKGEP